MTDLRNEHLQDSQTYVPIPELTRFFKTIAKADPTLETHLTVTTALRFLQWLAAETHAAHLPLSNASKVLLIKDVKRDFLRDLHDPSLLTPIEKDMDLVALLDLMLEYKSKIGDPSYRSHFACEGYCYYRSSSQGRRRIIHCAINPEADTDGTLAPILSRYLEDIVTYEPITTDDASLQQKINQEMRNRQDARAQLSVHPLPDMVVTLRSVLWKYDIEPPMNTPEHILSCLKGWIRVGVNIVDAWLLCRSPASPGALLDEVGYYKSPYPSC